MSLENEQSRKPLQPKGLPKYIKWTHEKKKPSIPEGLPKYMYAEEREEILRERQEKIDERARINLARKKEERKDFDLLARLERIDNSSVTRFGSIVKRYENLKDTKKIKAKTIAGQALRKHLEALDKINDEYGDEPGFIKLRSDADGLHQIISDAKKRLNSKESKVDKLVAADLYFIPTMEKRAQGKETKIEERFKREEKKEDEAHYDGDRGDRAK